MVSKKLITSRIDNYIRNNDVYISISTYNGDLFYLFEGDTKVIRRIENILNYYNIDYGWYDSFCLCTECYQVIRTELYYKPIDYYIGDGFIACNECFNSNNELKLEYLDNLINDYTQVNQLLTHEYLTNLGFILLDNNYQNGWYGIEDKPETIYNELKTQYKEVVFNITNIAQFSLSFNTYVRGGKEIK